MEHLNKILTSLFRINVIMVCCLLLNTNAIWAQDYELDPDLEFSSAKLNARGLFGNPGLKNEGTEIISNYAGNLMLKYELNEKIQNGLSVNMTLIYNANVEHRVFRVGQDPTNQEGHSINLPEWIIGINGIAVQTLNFENNFYLLQNDGTMGGGELTNPIKGEEIPLLLPGYHYSNRFHCLEPGIQKHKYDYINILMADGSQKVLTNTSDLTTDPNSMQGLYIETDVTSAVHAIVKNVSGQSYTREVWYKPGDGLTYYFQEYSVDYYGYSSADREYDPKIMYLKKIFNSDGAELEFAYTDPLCTYLDTDYGRKKWSSLSYSLSDTGTDWELGTFGINGNGTHIQSIDLTLNGKQMSGIITNQSGEGIYSKDRSDGLTETKIKYLSQVTDGENNANIISYNSSIHGTRKYEYPSAVFGNEFYLSLPLYLPSSINYYNGLISQFDFYHTPFTDSECTTTQYSIAFDFSSMKDYGCMTEVAFRDNYTSYMLKERKHYKDGSLDSLIWKENYTYDLQGEIYSPYDERYLQVNNILTTIEKQNMTNETQSSPETKSIYNFSKFYKRIYDDCFDPITGIIKGIFGETIKLMNETVYLDNQNYNKLSYQYDIDSVGYLPYCFGTFLKQSSSEEKSVNNKVMTKTTNYVREYHNLNIGGDSRDIVKKVEVTDPAGFKNITEYNTIFFDISSTNEDNYFNPTAVTDSWVLGLIGTAKEHKEYIYYETAGSNEGKIQTIKDYSNLSTESDRFVQKDFTYSTSNKFLEKVELDNGLINEYTYLFTSLANDVECQIVDYNELEFDVEYREWEVGLPSFFEPFKIETTLSGSSLAKYYRIRPCNDEIFIDENKYYYSVSLDNNNRKEALQQPGSWYVDDTNNPQGEFTTYIVDGGSYNSSSNIFDDVNNKITVTNKFDCDPGITQHQVSESLFDSFSNLEIIKNKNDEGGLELKQEKKYNYLGLVYKEKDGMGITKTYTYDFLGRLTSIKFDDVSVQTYSYYLNPEGYQISSMDYYEKVIFHDEEFNQIVSYYDISGNKIAEQIGTDDETIFEYDDFNQLERVASPMGYNTFYHYDGFGNLKWKESEDFGAYQYKNDRWGNTRYTFHSDDDSLLFTTYDELSRIIAIGSVDESTYSFSGLDPDTEETFESNENNMLIMNMYDNYIRSGVFDSLEYKSTQQIEEMNLKGRLSATAFKDRLSDDWSWKYYEYDYLGNIKKLNIKLANKPWKFIENEYDHIGNLVFQSINNEHYIWNEYDVQGRLILVKSNSSNNSTNAKVESSYSYNPADQIKKIGIEDEILDNMTISGTDIYEAPHVTASNVTVTSSGNLTLKGGASVTLNPGFSVEVGGQLDLLIDTDIGEGTSFGANVYAYNNRGWVEEIYNNSGGVVERFKDSLDYELNGNIDYQKIINKGNAGWSNIEFDYIYDNMNRLVTSTCNNSAYSESFQYDNNGNFASKVGDGKTYSYDYNDAGSYSNKLKKIDNYFAYEYDHKGNITLKEEDPGGTDLFIVNANDYDHRNLPLKVWQNSSGTTTYKYDDSGNRIVKNSGTVNDYYLRDHTGKEVAIYNLTTDAIDQVNLFGNGMIGYVKKGTADERFYYVKDHLGNIRLTIDEDSEVVNAKDYFVYGGITDRSVSYGEATRYDFTEKERDTETGLNYFGARYYDSDIGRWTSVDPLADKYPGYSPYNYSLNNPLKYIDPNGEFAIPIVVWAAVEIAASIGFTAYIHDKLSGTDGFGARQVNIGNPTTTSPSTEISGTVNLEHPGTFIDNGTTSVPADATNVGGNTETLIDQGVTPSTTLNSTGKGTATNPDGTKKTSVEQLKQIEKAQSKARKQKMGNKINSIKKSQQNVDHDLSRIKSIEDSKDYED